MERLGLTASPQRITSIRTNPSIKAALSPGEHALVAAMVLPRNLFSSLLLLASLALSAVQPSECSCGFGVNYAAVKQDIKDLIAQDVSTLGPGFVRLAWHMSGTYDKNTGTGGSCGATIRFSQELAHEANKGLDRIIPHLEPIYNKYRYQVRKRTSTWGELDAFPENVAILLFCLKNTLEPPPGQVSGTCCSKTGC